MAMPLPEWARCKMKEQYTLTIKAEPRPGLLHLVTGIIEKKLIRILSFNLETLTGDGIALIGTTIMIDAADLRNLMLKLENIVEVFSVTVSENNRVTNPDHTYSNSAMTAGIQSDNI